MNQKENRRKGKANLAQALQCLTIVRFLWMENNLASVGRLVVAQQK